jgi:hypothetical protein
VRMEQSKQLRFGCGTRAEVSSASTARAVALALLAVGTHRAALPSGCRCNQLHAGALPCLCPGPFLIHSALS